jgi:hypothetical protein
LKTPAWKPIPGYEQLYEVSDDGRVRSLTRDVVKPNHRCGRAITCTLKGKEKLPASDAAGYRFVCLYKGGVGKTFRVSRLVLSAFDRLPLAGEEACHRDHDRQNNAASNLQWGTRQANEDQKTASGRRPRTTRLNKLTHADALAIRRRYAEGEHAKTLAQEFNVHLTNVYHITNGKTWV